MARPIRAAPGKRDRGHGFGRIALAFAVAVAGAAVGPDGSAAAADGSGPEPSPWRLSSFESAPDASTESTIVEMPLGFTLKSPEDGKVGARVGPDHRSLPIYLGFPF